MQHSEQMLRKEIKIFNVVCTADLKQPIDIASFNKYKFLSSNLHLYRCGYVKDDTMQGRVTVFGNGKLISVGTKSPAHAYEELEKASKILKKYKLIKSHKIVPVVRNMVSSGFIGKIVNFSHLARVLPKSMYEPEQFPAVIYRGHSNVVSLIFASGKVVFAGAKTVEDINVAYYELQKKITAN